MGAPVQEHTALHLRRRGHARFEDVRLHQVRAGALLSVAEDSRRISRRYNKLVEPTVDLKPGARILLLKNIDTRNEAKKEQPLVNGTTGRILRWATADEAEAALKAREVYLEDKLEAAREQRLAKGKRSHETSLERKLYEELQKLREHYAQHCRHLCGNFTARGSC